MFPMAAAFSAVGLVCASGCLEHEAVSNAALPVGSEIRKALRRMA